MSFIEGRRQYAEGREEKTEAIPVFSALGLLPSAYS
jgi:hypothetical protein